MEHDIFRTFAFSALPLLLSCLTGFDVRFITTVIIGWGEITTVSGALVYCTEYWMWFVLKLLRNVTVRSNPLNDEWTGADVLGAVHRMAEVLHLNNFFGDVIIEVVVVVMLEIKFVSWSVITRNTHPLFKGLVKLGSMTRAKAFPALFLRVLDSK